MRSSEVSGQPGLDSRFDNDYLYFFEHQHGDAWTEAEEKRVAEVLGLTAGDVVLDAPCGEGRLSRRLAARGCRTWGVDLNEGYLEAARRKSPPGSVDYVHADLRSLPGEWSGKFDCVVNWFISLGYYDEEADVQILREFARVLRPGGRLLIEHVNLANHIARNPYGDEQTGVVEVGNDLMCLRTRFDISSCRNIVDRTILRGGVVVRKSFSLRFYSVPEFHSLLGRAGFSDISVSNRRGGELTIKDSRMLLLATRR